jgi:hypothetical protein
MFPYQSFRSGSPTILPATNIYLEIRILEEMVKERFDDMTGQKLLVIISVIAVGKSVKTFCKT